AGVSLDLRGVRPRGPRGDESGAPRRGHARRLCVGDRGTWQDRRHRAAPRCERDGLGDPLADGLAGRAKTAGNERGRRSVLAVLAPHRRAHRRYLHESARRAMNGLTVAITTRNRPHALSRCVRSLGLLAPLRARVLVFDDASEEPAARVLGSAADTGVDLAILRDERSVGYIVGRNRLMREATTPYVLLLDDDTIVLAREPI